MNRLLQIFLMVSACQFTVLQSLSACDVCGGGGGLSGGILPRIDRPFLGMVMNSSMLSYDTEGFQLGQNGQLVQDRIFSTNMVARVHTNYRTQLLISVPYLINTRAEQEFESTTRGVGDINVQVQYHVIDPINQLGKEWVTTMLAGAGIVLPTGKYQQRDGRRQLLPNFIQVGSGAFAFQGHFNTVLSRKGSGFHFESFYNYQLENELFYRRGHQSRIGLNYFKRINVFSNLDIFPTIGVNFDHFTADRDFGTDLEFTNRRQLNAQARIDFFSSSFNAGLFINVPLAQDRRAGQPDTRQFGLQCFYMLN